MFWLLKWFVWTGNYKSYWIGLDIWSPDVHQHSSSQMSLWCKARGSGLGIAIYRVRVFGFEIICTVLKVPRTACDVMDFPKFTYGTFLEAPPKNIINSDSLTLIATGFFKKKQTFEKYFCHYLFANSVMFCWSFHKHLGKLILFW